MILLEKDAVRLWPSLDTPSRSSSAKWLLFALTQAPLELPSLPSRVYLFSTSSDTGRWNKEARNFDPVPSMAINDFISGPPVKKREVHQGAVTITLEQTASADFDGDGTNDFLILDSGGLYIWVPLFLNPQFSRFSSRSTPIPL